uniref:Uncharacterized protein n=1 Tax=uncultured marine group II/III euryarchaeote KM3_195_B08 TaxID=1457970 RepID=A0A075GUY1_9EURY|nr:hypothetical protein [uncultured marine group II/III euryarchaeote KM3_195_B08]
MNDTLDELLDVCTSSGSYQLNLQRKLNLKEIEKKVSKFGEIIASTPVVLLVKAYGGGISIYQTGKIVFKDLEKSDVKKYCVKFLEAIGEKNED